MKRPRRTMVRLVGVLVALALLGTACGDDDTASDPTTTDGNGGEGDGGEGDGGEGAGSRYGGSITVGLEAESNTWLPGEARMAFAGNTVVGAIYDPLVAYNADGEAEPFLAESLEASDDLRQWTLKLREGVTFHDGTPLDAATLKWNFDELHFNADSLSFGVLNNSGVTGMEVVDEMTVRYDLSGPNAAFPDVLTIPAGWPVSRTAYEADPENFGDHPVGTGPFMVQEWTRDERLVVTRNENYWRTADNGDQLPYLDEIIFRPIPDETSRVQSLAAGDVDMIQTRRGSSIKELIEMADGGDFEAGLLVGDFSDTIILNTLEAPLDDIRIRRALAHATEVTQAQAVLDVDGLAEPSTGFYSEGSPWYSERVAAAYPRYDLAAAQALVEEYRNDPDRSDGGAPGSAVTVEYSCMPEPSQVELAQLVQSQWEQAGLVVELQQVDEPTNIGRVVGNLETTPPFRGTFSTACWQTGGGTDPLLTLQTFFGPVEITPTNFANLTSPEADAQVDIIRSSLDFDERFAAVEEIGLFAAEQLPVLWLSAQPNVLAYRSEVRGLADWTLPSGSTGTGHQLAIPRFYEVFLGS